MSDEARFDELFGEYYPAVARYVLARGFQAADADDLIAATFEVASRRLDAIPSGEEALPWLLSTARNFARNGVRLALAQLRPVDRDLVLLVAWDGLTPTGAGRVLGLLPVTGRGPGVR